MSSRSILGMTSTQSFGNDDKDDMDVNEMVEGLIHSMDGPQTKARSLGAVMDDEYSYTPASTRLTSSDEPNQLLQGAEFNSNMSGGKVARAQYRRKWLWRGVLLLGLIASLTVFALLIAKATLTASDSSATSTSSTSSNYVPKPPEDISTWCSAEYIASLGGSSATCQRVCNLAACCFSDNADTSCSTQYAETCALYSVCIGVVTITASPNTQDSNTDASTTPTTNAASSRQKLGPAPIEELKAYCQTGTSLDACTSYCSLAICCFDPVKEQNCYTYSNNHIACTSYSKFCNILGPPYGYSQPSTSTVDTTSTSSSSTEGTEGTDSETVVTTGGEDPNDIMDANNNTNASAIELGMPSHDMELSCTMVIESEQHSDPSNRLNTCKEACNPGTCCFGEGADNCRENNSYVCSQYDICTFSGVFSVPSNIIPSPPKRVFHQCNHAQKGSRSYHICTKICSAATCCFDESSESCLDVDKSSCSFYDPCLTLDGFNVQGSNTTTPLIMNYLRAPPEQLERDCLQYSMHGNPNGQPLQPDDVMGGQSKYTILETGTEDQSINICSKTCHEAYCCFAEGSDNCRANNLDICAMYDVCIFSGVSSRTSESIPVAPDSILTHCDGELVSSDIEAYHKCARMCASAVCCFDERNEICHDADKTSCTSYQICENLKNFIINNPPVVADQTILTDPPSQLEENCKPLISNSRFEGNDYNLCINHCRDGSCCFAAGEANCRERNQIVCAKYDICIFAGVEVLSSDIIPTPPDDFSITCSDERVAVDAATYRLCERMCAYATCCFASSDSCIYVDKSPCNLYQSCSNLRQSAAYQEDSLPMKNPAIDPKTNATIESGWPQIAGLMPEMSQHTPARFPGPMTVRVPEKNLSQLCDGQDSSRDKCQRACFYSACCIDPIAEKNCYNRSPDVCQMYSPCSVINAAYLNMTASSEQSIVPSPPSDLIALCAGEEGQSNSAGCRDACEVASCCISSINNCLEKNMEVCELYEVCLILPDVAQACSESSLADPVGKTLCQELCKDKACCFATPPAESCQSNWIECIPYSPCSKLNG